MRQDHNVLIASSQPDHNDARQSRRVRRIEAFAPAFRQQIFHVTAGAPWLEDLAESFPALLFAYASGYGEEAARARSIALVQAGVPLRTASAVLGLPAWLRRLPPAAFTAPLRPVPGGDDFASRIHGLVPGAPQAMGPWLARLLLANEVCGTEAALWIARQYKGAGPAPHDPAFLHILAWIWHSDRAGTVAHELMRRRWQPQFSARRAAEEVEHWRHRLALAIALGDGVKDTWLAEGQCRGYEFVALRTAQDFIAEAASMDNCLDQYAHRLEGRAVRLFSLRKGGRSVANLEIACHEQELGMPAIAQLRAARNRRAGMDVWQAAYAWLGGQTIRQANPALLRRDGPTRRRTTAKLWRPFLAELSEPTRAVFAAAFGTRTITAGARSRMAENGPAGGMRPRRRKAAGSGA